MILIPINTIVMTCSACPSQWDATSIDGNNIYIRVRHGYFRLEVDGEVFFSGEPDGVDGVMSTSEMINYVNNSSNRVRFYLN